MSIEIEPHELGFRRPFVEEVSNVLKIKNPNASPVAFKVKTTAPKQYCVRPNSGRIEPGHEVEVSVLLQAMKQEPPMDAKCRDKFLVQSVTITGDKEFLGVQQIWDSVSKSEVQEKKIRVNWLAASGSGEATSNLAVTPVKHGATNGRDETPEAPVSFSSPSPNQQVATPPSSVAAAPHTQSDIGETTGGSSSTLPITVPASVKAAADATYDELKVQLANAQAMITKLTEEASSGLRQRKGGAVGASEVNSSTTHPAAQAVRQGTEGVPVQIAAILCLVSFLLAYFFF